jgi:hypothetical protein
MKQFYMFFLCLSFAVEAHSQQKRDTVVNIHDPAFEKMAASPVSDTLSKYTVAILRELTQKLHRENAASTDSVLSGITDRTKIWVDIIGGILGLVLTFLQINEIRKKINEPGRNSPIMWVTGILLGLIIIYFLIQFLISFIYILIAAAFLILFGFRIYFEYLRMDRDGFFKAGTSADNNTSADK